jgi:hypothetical protein
VSGGRNSRNSRSAKRPVPQPNFNDRVCSAEIAVRKNHGSGAVPVKGLRVQSHAKAIECPRLRDGECALRAHSLQITCGELARVQMGSTAGNLDIDPRIIL